MVIKQDIINGAKLSLDLVCEMQQTIYAHTKRNKQTISVDDLKNAGTEKLSQDMFNFIAKLKNLVGYLEPIITAAAESTVEFKQLKCGNDKLQEYSNIYSKMEEGFQDWKNTIQTEENDKETTVSVPDSTNCSTLTVIIKEELNKINPVIRATIKDAVRSSMEKEQIKIVEAVNAIVETSTEKTVKSYATVTAGHKELMEEVKVVSIATPKKMIQEVIAR